MKFKGIFLTSSYLLQKGGFVTRNETQMLNRFPDEPCPTVNELLGLRSREVLYFLYAALPLFFEA